MREMHLFEKLMHLGRLKKVTEVFYFFQLTKEHLNKLIFLLLVLQTLTLCYTKHI